MEQKPKTQSAIRQRRYRDRKKKEQEADAFEYQDIFESRHPERVEELNQHVRAFTNNVMEQLGRTASSEEQYALDSLARTLYSMTRGWIHRTSDGDIAGGMYFPDAIGAVIVEAAHKFNLLASPTFAESYRELLAILNERYGQDQTEHARAVRKELARPEEMQCQ